MTSVIVMIIVNYDKLISVIRLSVNYDSLSKQLRLNCHARGSH